MKAARGLGKARKTSRKTSRKSYRVGRSNCGLGLFATAPIENGALIIEYKGRRITHAEAERLEKRGSRYMFEINSRWTVDGSSRRNIARYANHSCRPNAESDIVKGKMILRAIRKIKPDEEITYDYGQEYFELFLEPVGCKCPKCMENKKKKNKKKRKAGR